MGPSGSEQLWAEDPKLSPEVDASFDKWRTSGLGEPFVPARFASGLSSHDEWSWGCLLDYSGWGPSPAATEPDPYLLAPEVSRFLSGDWRQRFYVGHGGQGANSYAITYVIVTDRAAVFAQRGWGGVYMNAQRAAASVVTMGGALRSLLDAIDEHAAWPDGRLVVVDSSFRGAERPMWMTSPDSEPIPLLGEDAQGLSGGMDFVASITPRRRGIWGRV